MSTHHGKNGVVRIGANSVAEVTGFSYTYSADVAEDHACGDAYKTRLAGIADINGGLSCHYDPSDTNGQDVLVAGASVTLLLYPEDGVSTGETEVSIPAIITEVGVDLERDSVTSRSFTFVGNSASGPTEGTVT